MRRWFHWKKRFYSFSLSACSVPAAFQKKLTRLSLLLHQRLWRKPDPRRSPIRRSSCHRQLDLWNQNAGRRSGLDPMQWHQSRSRYQAVLSDRKSSARSHRACAMHPGNREHPIMGELQNTYAVSPLIQNERVWSPKEFRECPDSFFISRTSHKAEKPRSFLISRSLILLHPLLD